MNVVIRSRAALVGWLDGGDEYQGIVCVANCHPDAIFTSIDQRRVQTNWGPVSVSRGCTIEGNLSLMACSAHSTSPRRGAAT